MDLNTGFFSWAVMALEGDVDPSTLEQDLPKLTLGQAISGQGEVLIPKISDELVVTLLQLLPKLGKDQFFLLDKWLKKLDHAGVSCPYSRKVCEGEKVTNRKCTIIRLAISLSLGGYDECWQSDCPRFELCLVFGCEEKKKGGKINHSHVVASYLCKKHRGNGIPVEDVKDLSRENFAHTLYEAVKAEHRISNEDICKVIDHKRPGGMNSEMTCEEAACLEDDELKDLFPGNGNDEIQDAIMEIVRSVREKEKEHKASDPAPLPVDDTPDNQPSPDGPPEEHDHVGDEPVVCLYDLDALLAYVAAAISAPNNPQARYSLSYKIEKDSGFPKKITIREAVENAKEILAIWAITGPGSDRCVKTRRALIAIFENIAMDEVTDTSKTEPDTTWFVKGLEQGFVSASDIIGEEGLKEVKTEPTDQPHDPETEDSLQQTEPEASPDAPLALPIGIENLKQLFEGGEAGEALKQLLELLTVENQKLATKSEELAQREATLQAKEKSLAGLATTLQNLAEELEQKQETMINELGELEEITAQLKDISQKLAE